MPQFQFRLAALQRYREHLRDVVRQQLGELLARDAALEQQQADLVSRREGLLGEMLDLQQQPRLNVDRSAARRYHAGQLAVDVAGLNWQRQQLAGLIAACREQLLRADQGVKVLDQLSDRQRAEFQKAEESRETRQREETWQAGQLVRQRENGVWPD